MKLAGRPRGPARRPTGLDLAGVRRGRYSDAYFLNAAAVLRALSGARAAFTGEPLALHGRLPRSARYAPGDAVVEMQFFARRSPHLVAAGVAIAVDLLRDLSRRRRSAPLQVRAVPEGSLTRPLEPVLVVRGRYRDFAHLETPILGVLTRSSRIATNVYEALIAARGKPVLFFPARFDLPQTQEVDGYAYRVALAAYARRAGRRRPTPQVSTQAQAASWGGSGAGTTSHAYVLCFLGDTAEAMAAFCRHLPPRVPRAALVDTTNDCVGESLRTARRLFSEHLRHLRAGRRARAQRFLLHAVRADTSQDLRDRSVPPSPDPRMARGVTPVLVRRIREALDRAPRELDLPERWRRLAERYFRSIRIVATGGFDAERIAFFERHRAPVDVYGVGSAFLRGPVTDFTADVVRVRIGRRFRTVAKAGRGARRGPLLRRVEL
ncbi:MAG: nicotinate phosphoribosyltransferase [Acidobacteriota bacterium]